MKSAIALRSFEITLKILAGLFVLSLVGDYFFSLPSGTPLSILTVALNVLVVMSWMGYLRIMGPGGIEERVWAGSFVRAGFFIGEFVGGRFAFNQFDNAWSSGEPRVNTILVFSFAGGIIAAGAAMVIVRIFNLKEFLRDLR